MLSKKLLERIKTQSLLSEVPVYVYDKDLIIEACNSFNAISYPNTSIHFATMANCNADFLKVIKAQGLNVFVNSLRHLEEVKKIGFTEKQIIFTASAISKDVIHKIYEENIYVNLDSISQLSYWRESFPDRPVGIRCNINNNTHPPKSSRAGFFIGEDSRLGLNLEEIKSIEKKELINGLHIYVGTDIINIDYFISFYKALINISKYFPNLEYLDFGGGFGIDEKNNLKFDFAAYGLKVSQLMNRFSEEQGKSIKLIIEPGRIIGGQSGYFICQITDIKKRNNIQFIGVNASSAQFPRPLLYPNEANHPVWLLNENGSIKNGQTIESKVSGCSTYSKDYLSYKSFLPKAKIGDYLIFENSGAYCAAVYTIFLGFDKPKELFI